MEQTLLAILKEAGPFVTLIAFFVWRDYKREQSLGKVNTEQQQFIQTTLLTLLEKTLVAITGNTAAIQKCVKGIHDPE